MSADTGLRPAGEIIEACLAASRARDCVVIVEETSDVNVRFANNTTTTNGRRRDRHVSVTAMVEVNGGIGVGVAAGSGSVDPLELVAAAEADASAATPAEDAYELVEGEADDGFAAPPGEVDFGALSGMLAQLGEALGRARGTDRVLAGFVTQEIETTYLGTSQGVRRRHLQPTGSLELVARSSDGERSTWAGRGAAAIGGVDLLALEAGLATRLELARRRVELPAGRYETILPPDAVADLVIELGAALSGRDALDGRSVFSAPGGRTRLGERLTPLDFVLESDPSLAGLECAGFLAAAASSADVSVFDNGAEVVPARYLDEGVLARLYFHRAAASLSGVEFTPPIDNLRLSVPGASGSLEDLIAATDRALLLTCCWYIREVDPQTLLLTGLTRDGVYLVENGEITGAVNNFRFNESPLEMLRRTVEVGTPGRCLSREWGEWLNRTEMPPIRVEGFNMSSVSQAS